MTSFGPKYRKFGAVGFYGGFTVFFTVLRPEK